MRRRTVVLGLALSLTTVAVGAGVFGYRAFEGRRFRADLDRAKQELLDGRHNTALQHLRGLADRRPDDAELLFLIGVGEDARGRPDLAVSAWGKIDPGDAPYAGLAAIQWAEQERERGRLTAAEDRLRDALARPGTHRPKVRWRWSNCSSWRAGRRRPGALFADGHRRASRAGRGVEGSSTSPRSTRSRSRPRGSSSRRPRRSPPTTIASGSGRAHLAIRAGDFEEALSLLDGLPRTPARGSAGLGDAPRMRPGGRSPRRGRAGPGASAIHPRDGGPDPRAPGLGRAARGRPATRSARRSTHGSNASRRIIGRWSGSRPWRARTVGGMRPPRIGRGGSSSIGPSSDTCIASGRPTPTSTPGRWPGWRAHWAGGSTRNSGGRGPSTRSSPPTTPAEGSAPARSLAEAAPDLVAALTSLAGRGGSDGQIAGASAAILRRRRGGRPALHPSERVGRGPPDPDGHQRGGGGADRLRSRRLARRLLPPVGPVPPRAGLGARGRPPLPQPGRRDLRGRHRSGGPRRGAGLRARGRGGRHRQ